MVNKDSAKRPSANDVLVQITDFITLEKQASVFPKFYSGIFMENSLNFVSGNEQSSQLEVEILKKEIARLNIIVAQQEKELDTVNIAMKNLCLNFYKS